MSKPQPYGYYYGNEADQYNFYRLPKILFTNARYKGLSDGAKILFGLMLDRMGLSVKNSWLDEKNRVYIIFTLEDVQEFMNCKHDKAIKMLAELDTIKGVGLIERVKQGQGKPAIIYVRKFFDTAEVLTSEKPKSAHRQNRSQDFGNSECNNNDFNNTDFNDTENQSIYPERNAPDIKSEVQNAIDKIDRYRELIKENLDYDYLVNDYTQERIDEIVEIITSPISIPQGFIQFTAKLVSGK